MLARKIFFYLLPPIVVACIIGGIYLSNRQSTTQGEEAPSTTDVPFDTVATSDPMGENSDLSSPVGSRSDDGTGNAATPDLETTDAQPAMTREELLAIAPTFSDSPIWAKLLGQTTPVMRVVKAIDAVANGERPVDALDFLHVDTAFTAQRNATGEWVATKASYDRYQDAVDFLTSIPPEEIAKWFKRAEPVLQQSCRQLGYQDKSIRDLLYEACQTLLAVPSFSTGPTLVPTGTTGTYHFADSAFENLNDAQKLLVRLGPTNCAKIQAQCQAIIVVLELKSRQ